MGNFVTDIDNNFSPIPERSIFNQIWEQYQRVIIESALSAFCLDFLMLDKHGGDVDTINNVRQIGIDPRMQYKDKRNELAYNNRPEYKEFSYHQGNSEYARTRREAKKDFYNNGTLVKDEYTENNLYFNIKDTTKEASLDHVIAAKEIESDRGRVLAGLSGEALANSPDNLKFTNRSLNSSMGKKSIPEYLKEHPELPEKTKKNMMDAYNTARKNYETKLAQAYYTSPQFRKDVKNAALTSGVKKGMIEVLGFITLEIIFSVQDEIKEIKQKNYKIEDIFKAIGDGIKKGYDNSIHNYEALYKTTLKGSITGILSSLTTSLCNIFFSTAKNTIRIIRQCYGSLIKAIEVLFINPDCYLFGERIRAVMKIVATGGSVACGILVTDALEKTPIESLGKIGTVLKNFIGSFVTGIMSCSLLMYLDNDKNICKLVKWLDQNITTIETEVSYYRKNAEYFEKYAADLFKIDITELQKEINIYTNISNKISTLTEDELSCYLENTIELLGIEKAWKGDFNNFMENKDNQLIFK